MPEQTPESVSFKLPDRPNLTWLRKQAKTRLSELRRRNHDAKLAEAQFEIRDSKHDGDAFGWAEFFKKPEIVQLLTDRAAGE
jgi:hypothetical protein